MTKIYWIFENIYIYLMWWVILEYNMATYLQWFNKVQLRQRFYLQFLSLLPFSYFHGFSCVFVYFCCFYEYDQTHAWYLHSRMCVCVSKHFQHPFQDGYTWPQLPVTITSMKNVIVITNDDFTTLPSLKQAILLFNQHYMYLNIFYLLVLSHFLLLF